MRQSIAHSQAPVIFSHSGARALVEHPRNVPDDVLKLIAEHDGVVMMNFYPGYASNEFNRWNADVAAETARFNSPPYDGLYIGQPAQAAEHWLSREAAASTARGHDRAGRRARIDHIVKVAGIDHVGLGSDFDGIEVTPRGLESVADYPNLFAELIRRGWTDDMLAKLAGQNLLRVMRKAEAVAASMKALPRAP